MVPNDLCLLVSRPFCSLSHTGQGHLCDRQNMGKGMSLLRPGPKGYRGLALSFGEHTVGREEPGHEQP